MQAIESVKAHSERMLAHIRNADDFDAEWKQIKAKVTEMNSVAQTLGKEWYVKSMDFLSVQIEKFKEKLYLSKVLQRSRSA